MTPADRVFAVIPAAGLSRRMGQPKLLLPLGGISIIHRLLLALEHPSIAARYVVVRRTDAPLQKEASHWGGSLIVPAEDPTDMRTSVTLALDAVERHVVPCDDDGWLLVPADHPVLDKNLIDSLLTFWGAERPKILVPRRGNRRGHPTLFRWSYARQVAKIPHDRGLNWLLREYASDVTEFPVDTEAAVTDLDTPEDYERLQEIWNKIAV